MKKMISAYRAKAAQRAQYRQIRDEIAALPRHEALDLGFYPEDAGRIAAQTVWG